jgi:hypothetical protein
MLLQRFRVLAVVQRPHPLRSQVVPFDARLHHRAHQLEAPFTAHFHDARPRIGAQFALRAAPRRQAQD